MFTAIIQQIFQGLKISKQVQSMKDTGATCPPCDIL